MKTLLVNGSPRKGGNTASVLKKIAEGLEKEEVSTELVNLSDYEIHPCIGCEQCRKDKTCTRFYDGMHLLYPKIEESRGLVAGSPTYSYNMTPVMKAFIDRLYPYFNFENPRPGPYSSRLQNQGRKLVVMTVGEQNEAKELGYTIPAMRDAIAVLGYEAVAELTVTGHFASGSVKKDAEVLERAFETGIKLARHLKKAPFGGH